MSRATRELARDVTTLLAVGIPYVWLTHRFWFVCDDAFISFRYAQNWARGYGLRYNLGDHVPVEGYSNFLWVMVCAAFESVSANVVFWAPFVSFCCGLVLLWRLYVSLIHRLNLDRPVAFLAVFGLSCFPPFAVWGTGGLETMPFSLSLFTTFELMFLRSRRLPEPDRVAPAVGALWGLAASLLRPEGIVWAVLIGVGSGVTRRVSGLEWRRRLGIYFAVLGSGFAVYYACRYAYYGVPLPNPMYTKVHFGPDVLLRGFRYVAIFYLTFLTSFLILPAFANSLRSRFRARALPAALMAVAVPSYAMVVGGDWMTMGRFLVPGLAFQAIVFACLLQSFWSGSRPRQALLSGAVGIAVAVSLLPAWNIHPVPRTVRAPFRFMYSHPGFRSEYQRWVLHSSDRFVWKEVGLALRDYARPGDSLVVGAIGAVGYYSGLFIYDRFGLVSREVALLPRGDGPLRSPGHDVKVSRGFFLDRHPTFLVFDVIKSSELRERVIGQANEWRSWSPGLWRRYVPDFMPLGEGSVEKEGRLLMVYRAIEEEPSDAIRELERPERRRVRARRAEKLWNALYEKAQALPSHAVQ